MKLVRLATVTVSGLINLNLKRTYLNKLLLTVNTSHVVVIAPTDSFVLHTARNKFCSLTYSRELIAEDPKEYAQVWAEISKT